MEFNCDDVQNFELKKIGMLYDSLKLKIRKEHLHSYSCSLKF